MNCEPSKMKSEFSHHVVAGVHPSRRGLHTTDGGLANFRITSSGAHPSRFAADSTAFGTKKSRDADHCRRRSLFSVPELAGRRAFHRLAEGIGSGPWHAQPCTGQSGRPRCCVSASGICGRRLQLCRYSRGVWVRHVGEAHGVGCRAGWPSHRHWRGRACGSHQVCACALAARCQQRGGCVQSLG